MEDLSPSSHNVDVPHVSRTDYTLLDITDDGFVSRRLASCLVPRFQRRVCVCLFVCFSSGDAGGNPSPSVASWALPLLPPAPRARPVAARAARLVLSGVTGACAPQLPQPMLPPASHHPPLPCPAQRPPQVSLMTEGGDTKDDLQLPSLTDEATKLAEQIKADFDAGKELCVSVMKVRGSWGMLRGW